MLNVITVKTGNRYSADYVSKMRKMVDKYLAIPHIFWCLTDDPTVDASIIVPSEIFEGWWNKLYLFSALMPPGPLLYLDLDQILTGDITDIVQTCLKHPFSCYADHLEWMGVKLGTAFMTFQAHSFLPVFDQFKQDYASIKNHPGGDQVYLGDKLPSVYYLNEDYPWAVKSYKFDLQGPPGSQTKIVNFHGNPKPHQVTDYWVLTHWRGLE